MPETPVPQISVIVVNYNTFELTCACIRSVFEKTAAVTFEVILVDNASTECNADLFVERFPGIVLVKNSTNAGFARGNNLGISYAKGECILLLNSDAELLNDAISIAYGKLVAKKPVAVVTGKLIYPDGRVQHQCGRFPSVGLQVIELLRLQKFMTAQGRGKLLLGTYFDYTTPVYPDWVWGTFFLIKREVVGKMTGGKLPEDFFMYAEDLQWCYLIKRMGYKIFYEPSALVLHHFSQSTRKNKAIQQNLMIIKNEDIFLRANYGWIHTKLIYLFKVLNLTTLLHRDPANKALIKTYLTLLFQVSPQRIV